RWPGFEEYLAHVVAFCGDRTYELFQLVGCERGDGSLHLVFAFHHADRSVLARGFDAFGSHAFGDLVQQPREKVRDRACRSCVYRDTQRSRELGSDRVVTWMLA